MEYRTFGRTGLKVSEIGFGAWGIGGEVWGKPDDEASIRALHRAFELGVTFYDTAYAYGDGHSEELIAEALGSRRDDLVLATKIPPKTYQWPARPGQPVTEVFPKQWVIDCTERSLRKLKTDVIDIQQLHTWIDEYNEQLDWLEAFEKLRDQGKIRFFGVSSNDWDPVTPTRLIESDQIDSVQVIYNIWEQRPEEKLLPAAKEHNVGIIVRVPFEEGILAGILDKFDELPADDFRRQWLTPDRLAEATRRVEALKPFLADDRPDLATLALKFCLANPATSTVIPGMRKASRVEANVKASDGIPLPDDVREALKDHAFAHGWNYPWMA